MKCEVFILHVKCTLFPRCFWYEIELILVLLILSIIVWQVIIRQLQKLFFYQVTVIYCKLVDSSADKIEYIILYMLLQKKSYIHVLYFDNPNSNPDSNHMSNPSSIFLARTAHLYLFFMQLNWVQRCTRFTIKNLMQHCNTYQTKWFFHDISFSLVSWNLERK